MFCFVIWLFASLAHAILYAKLGFNASNWEQGASSCELAPTTTTFENFRDVPGGNELRAVGVGLAVRNSSAAACFFRLPAAFVDAPPPVMFFACLIEQPVERSVFSRTGIFVADDFDNNGNATFYHNGLIVGSETGAVLTSEGWVASSEDNDVSSTAIRPSQTDRPVLVVVRVVNGLTSIAPFSPGETRTESAFNATAVSVVTRNSIASGPFTLSRMRRIAIVGARITVAECRAASTFDEAATNALMPEFTAVSTGQPAPSTAASETTTSRPTSSSAPPSTLTSASSRTTDQPVTTSQAPSTTIASALPPSAVPASDNTALIAGIVGAFVGAAIITGVIVGLVCRRRRRTQAGSEMNTARNDEEPSSSRTGMYQQLPLTANPLKEYSVGNVNPD